MPTGRSELAPKVMGKIGRTILLVLAGALVLNACGGGSDEDNERPAHDPGASETVSPSTSPGRPSLTASERRRVAIAAAVFDAIYLEQLGDQPSDAYGRVILNTLICGIPWESPGHPESGGVMPAWGEDAVCQEPFSPEEQASLLTALADLPDVTFTSEPDEVADRLLDGDLAGIGVFLSLGPIEGVGRRVEVPAKAECGLRCMRWGTFVVERGADGWEVTGKTGPFGMA